MPNVKKSAADFEIVEQEEEHNHNHDHGHGHDYGMTHHHDHDHKKGHDHHNHGHDHKHEHEHKHEHKNEHKHEHKHEDKHDHGHSHGHNHGHGHSHENLNMRAAIIHIFGDIIQSIGVLIAAIIIYFKPEYYIADPICTFIFTVLVMFTTIPIFRECVSVLMEATPTNINAKQVYKDLLEVNSSIISNFL